MYCVDSDAYAELFALADADKDGQVSVQEVSFLRKSGLSNEQLGQIWVLSSEGQMALSKAAFTRALKLVWCAQNGKPLSLESAASVTGVPVFEGVTLKVSACTRTPLSNISSLEIANSRRVHIGACRRANERYI
jgi:hypothetical protein